jgi:serine/threonine-protein kinase
VTVIGETGMPRWYRWRAGEASTQISLAPDGSFSVHTWSLCLLELVPSVRQESYRITMEVRHEKSDISGEAGFFFAYHAYPGREGDIQLFTQLTYNDVRNVTEMFDLLPEKERKKAAAGNRAYLFPHLYSEGKEGSVIDRRMSGPAGPPFKASNMGNRWRRLEVLVTPAAIQSSWDGNPLKDFALADLLERVDDNWTDLRSLRPDDPFVQGVPAEFPASGGLGLYLFYGSASYRNVTITPVPGADPAPPGGP